MGFASHRKRYSVFNLDQVDTGGFGLGADGLADTFDSADEAIAFAYLLRCETHERVIATDTRSGETIWSGAEADDLLA